MYVWLILFLHALPAITHFSPLLLQPAAELQAIDRCHRLGQHRPIRAIRFVAEGTVEERVLQLQEKKRLVFDGTVGGDAGSLKMLTVDDMKALFA
jgi:DNA repair protein RAD16